MAKPTQTERPRGPGKSSQMAIYALLGLLVVGLGGFGIENFGRGAPTVGSVGGREIATSDYDRDLQQAINSLSNQIGQPVPFAIAQARGLDQQILNRLVTNAALYNEADRIGVSVGDDVVRQNIAANSAFQGLDGSFDKVAYRAVLQQNNLTETNYEAGLRDDVARSLLQGAIVGGFTAPDAMTNTLYDWVAERRGFTVLKLGVADLTTPTAAPTDADLQAFYDANIALFTKPEAKHITYVALLPDAIAASMAVDEDKLKKDYDARLAEFVQPEKRLVERLVYPTDADATAAKKRLDAGEVTFDALVTERGVRLEDIDLGDVGKADLGTAGDGVFALTEPGVVGPFASEFGPALFRMNAILAAQETTFAAAREQLVGEQQADAARRSIAGRAEAINDALAGGATLEELATEQKMQIASLDYVPGGQNDDPMAGYEGFRNAADAVADGDFPTAILLEEGGLVALRLDSIVAAAPIPFADAKAAVTTAWDTDALKKALSARAIEVKSAVEGGAAIGTFGIVSVTPEIAREGFVEGTPPDLITAAFGMVPGDVRVIEAGDFVGLVQLNVIKPAEQDTDDAKALKDALAVQFKQAIAQDAFAAFSSALSTEAGIKINDQAVAAVNAKFN
jgi:peptidyl-prolyl cis-trans isomerase D